MGKDSNGPCVWCGGAACDGRTGAVCESFGAWKAGGYMTVVRSPAGWRSCSNYGATSQKTLKNPFRQDWYRLEFLFGGMYISHNLNLTCVADFYSNHRASAAHRWGLLWVGLLVWKAINEFNSTVDHFVISYQGLWPYMYIYKYICIYIYIYIRCPYLEV